MNDKEIPWPSAPTTATHYYTGNTIDGICNTRWRKLERHPTDPLRKDIHGWDTARGWMYITTIAVPIDPQEYIARPALLPLQEAVGAAVTAEKAIRFDSGKPQLSLVLEMRKALEGASRGLEEGVIKYGRGNYAKGDGLPLDKILDSLLRHASAYASGEMLDQDSKDANGNPVPHVDKILTNALMLAELWHRKNDS